MILQGARGGGGGGPILNFSNFDENLDSNLVHINNDYTIIAKERQPNTVKYITLIGFLFLRFYRCLDFVKSTTRKKWIYLATSYEQYSYIR